MASRGWLGHTPGMRKSTQACDARQVFATNMLHIWREKCLILEPVAAAADLHPNYVIAVERAERKCD